jgi:glycerol-3-phosphate dehydrogenase (NAD(P)+)
MNRSTIIGSGSWGTTLGLLLSSQGKDVTILTRNIRDENRLITASKSGRHIGGHEIPSSLSVSSDYERIIPNTDLVIFAVPSPTLRNNTKHITKYLKSSTIILSATKGLENVTNKTMTDVIMDESDNLINEGQVGAISGPNLSGEILEGKLALTTVAFTNLSIATTVQKYLKSPTLRPYTSTDLIGVQYGGALKNIIAIASGFVDGSNLGNNAKASLITRGLNEIKTLGMSQGAQEETFYGLSGIGDLITTCYSKLSRNYRFGNHLAKGLKVESCLAEISGTVEGLNTTTSAYSIMQKHKLELPIISSIYKVLYEDFPPNQLIRDLMSRNLREEL